MELHLRPAIWAVPSAVGHHQNLEQEVPHAVIATEADGRIVGVNAAAMKLLHCSERGALGCLYHRFLKVLDVSSDMEVDAFADPVARCLTTGESCLRLGGLAYAADGEPQVIDGAVAPTYNEHCEIVGAVLMISAAAAQLPQCSLESRPQNLRAVR